MPRDYNGKLRWGWFPPPSVYQIMSQQKDLHPAVRKWCEHMANKESPTLLELHRWHDRAVHKDVRKFLAAEILGIPYVEPIEIFERFGWTLLDDRTPIREVKVWPKDDQCGTGTERYRIQKVEPWEDGLTLDELRRKYFNC